MINKRTVSAPYFLMSGWGGTTLPFDFDIFAPFFNTMPCVSKRLKGSLEFTEYLLTTKKVAIVPGIAFGADNHARLSFAASLDKIEEGIKRIQEAVELLK